MTLNSEYQFISDSLRVPSWLCVSPVIFPCVLGYLTVNSPKLLLFKFFFYLWLASLCVCMNIGQQRTVYFYLLRVRDRVRTCCLSTTTDDHRPVRVEA